MGYIACCMGIQDSRGVMAAYNMMVLTLLTVQASWTPVWQALTYCG